MSELAAPPAQAGASTPGGRLWRDLRGAISGVVVGGEQALRLLLVALLTEGHALIEDVPGVGKTLLARAFARGLDLDFARIQGTPDLLPGDVTGSSLLEAGRLRFAPGPVFTNVLLFDEINRATPRTQSALLEAMPERQVSVDGTTHQLEYPFLVLATQNPIELDGTFTLPEAQLDRFLVQLVVGYPDETSERAIARRYRDAAEPLDRVRPVVDRAAVLRHREATRTVLVAPAVERYIVALVRETRSHPDLRLGASPRASVALYRASQAWAYLSGRDFVIPDDVQAVAVAVLAHRLIVDLDHSLRGASPEGVIAEILARVPTDGEPGAVQP